MDGICLCNHYQSRYVTDGNAADFARRYVEEFHATRALGREMDLRVLFGIEVTMERHENEHLLVYGVDESFPLLNPALYDLTQKDLYRLVHANGGVVVQAHPLRKGKNVLMDPQYLDGVEINCHPKYDCTHHQELAQLAGARSCILTCGGDYHADTHRVKCGMYLPEKVTTGVELGAYLKNSTTLRLCVQEVGEMTTFEKVYTR
jgi:predicted metal-dependent phosphoesterase TrpH